MNLRNGLAILALSYAVTADPAGAQMKIDVSADVARRAANITYVDDLAVHDTALIYQAMCIENGGVYIVGWARPADLANDTYQQTGLLLRIEVLPGKKLKGTLVDAAQAQGIAKGHPNEPKKLTAAEYNAEVIHYVYNLFDGGFFGIQPCEDERRSNPLRTLNLLSLESINGYTKISELLTSVTSGKNP